jgi:hypothetical protein
MPDKVIASPEQATAEWLTAVLSRSGALTTGGVSAVELRIGQGNWSSHARLEVRYAAGSRGTLPQRLFLKMVNADLGDESFGPSEVNYYTRDYVGVEGAPIVSCYDAAFSAAQRRYHVLLEDLSDTHVPAAERTPTLAYGLALAEGLAAMHARWWGALRLAEADASIHSADHIDRFVRVAEPGVGHILGRFSAALEPHWPELMAALVERLLPALLLRTRNDNGFTIIHGDAGQHNILTPRSGDRPIYLIDRQPFDWSLTTWLGVYDLAYAMVLDWDIDTRRRLEEPVLRRYHDHLAARGVTGYPWQRLLDDYRLSAAMGVLVATEYCRGGVNERWIPVWLTMLQRSLTACDDLKCAELWAHGGNACAP